MFRIRRIHDATLVINKEAVAQIQKILREQFTALAPEAIEKLADQLHDPLKYRFRSQLIVMDDTDGQVKGFALLQHAADLNFCYLDYISAALKKTGRGIGSILYERVRDEAKRLGTIGIFFECLPDDPALCRNKELLPQNIARLKFYERYNARPIINTAYETPLSPEDDCPPYLVFDDLESGEPLKMNQTRKIVKAILQRKYADICPPEYVQKVVSSFKDEPVRLRDPRYLKKNKIIPVRENIAIDSRIALVVNDRHDIHHVRERGYVEAPVRIKSILKDILPTGLFMEYKTQRFPEKHIYAVHDAGFVNYLKKVCANVPANKSIYPYVFPVRNAARPPKDLPTRAGYYCIDTFTPLNQNAFLAAKRAVDSTLTAAQCVLQGHRLAYALVRPPGHHAEYSSFGGFCYFNSAAVAAAFLAKHGRVAILDLDYHHGNGQQEIFYKRDDVLTISIHGHPSFAYPYFTGFEEEKGQDIGEGFNFNFPLPERLNGEEFRKVLQKAIKIIRNYGIDFLVLAMGFDTAKHDPTGTWSLSTKDFELNGGLLAGLKCPILVVQEGGYRVRSLGINARHFFTGLWEATEKSYYLKLKGK
ncbi:MAG: histone deacetylase family protein [Calditrichaeota bacterium]|nr:histone deacetylase family protein [Calditrichota bacterium]